jgi:DNA replication protein DnaC
MGELERLGNILPTARVDRPETGIVPEEGPSSLQAGTPIPQSLTPVCPQCKDWKWLRANVPYGHPQFGKLVECECLLQKRREKRQRQLFSLSGLPDMPDFPTLDTFLPHMAGVAQAYEVVCAFVSLMTSVQKANVQSRQRRLQELGWIVLLGPVGVGKTHLAIAVTMAAIDAGIITLFAIVPDLLDHLRAAYKPDAEVTYDELFERMKTAELLVLDDLGTQRSSPWANEKLFQLVNHRYLHRLPTMVTLNGRAWEQLDERLQSRLSHQNLVELVDLRGATDYRRRQDELVNEN